MTTPTIPDLALDQFLQRQRFWQDQRAAGKCTAEEADARLHPWLAIALLAGADPARLHPRLPDMIADRIGPNRFCTPAQAVALVAEDHSPRGEALAVLAHSRDAAIDQLAQLDPPLQGRGTTAGGGGAPAAKPAVADKRIANAQALARLAAFLGAPGYQGKAFTERKAA
jgi:hypothetical protein